MKKLLIALMFLSSGALANSSYFGFSIAEVDYLEDSVDYVLPTGFARLGKNFTDVFSGEVRYGYGVSDDYTKVNGKKIDQELKDIYGAYFKIGYPVSEKIYPYYVVGFTKAKTNKTDVLRASTSVSESDNSMGIGADISISNASSFNVEYMQYIDYKATNIEMKGFSFGIVSKF